MMEPAEEAVSAALSVLAQGGAAVGEGEGVLCIPWARMRAEPHKMCILPPFSFHRVQPPLSQPNVLPLWRRSVC